MGAPSSAVLVLNASLVVIAVLDVKERRHTLCADIGRPYATQTPIIALKATVCGEVESEVVLALEANGAVVGVQVALSTAGRTGLADGGAG